MDSMIFYILSIVLVLISFVIQAGFRKRAKKYAESSLMNGMSGAEIARAMLQDNNIYDVEVTHTPGQLTDHYNPQTKTVNLSDEVFHGRSTLAAAVAAHECGHAVQHAKAYSWLEFRSAMVGPVSFASRYVHWLILGGILAIIFFNASPALLLAGIGLFALTTLFTFVTLPVEFDASKRALAWLDNKNQLSSSELGEAKNALNWAASTYVMAALSSLATLLYYVSMFMGMDD